MTLRARRMARALESMGWQVASGVKKCGHCGQITYDDTAAYCYACGTHLPKSAGYKGAHDELEAAIAYALGETKALQR